MARHVPHVLAADGWDGPILPLSEDQAHHLRRVLRLADGEEVSYTDGSGRLGVGRMVENGVERGEEWTVPRPIDLTVAVAPPKSKDRARFLVEKLAELGVARLLWVKTRFTEGKPPAAAKARAWAVAALEQSRGAWLMSIGESDLADLDSDGLVVADPHGDEPPSHAKTLLVGPEGGLHPAELPPGADTVSLGSTILRVETAAIVGAALLGLPTRR
jgi:16S rRNA (uracil1498-N3)-methyltransferase